jgi:DNA polymerase III delta prime subunit
MINNNNIPFVEKYRPKNFDNIVLDDTNKQILQNIISTSYFPNLLLYGPPGTGKTTTIINLVKSYQERLGQNHKGLTIHLNASDERGIDIIRNQINVFVNSKALFNEGMKFVILDEVDYMTDNAQKALRYLLQKYSNNVRFCLICNYISRINVGLQNEFLRLRFNQLPENDIISFLKHITVAENINLNDTSLTLIQRMYKSDVRSMINFIQSNQQNINNLPINIIDEIIWIQLYELIKNETPIEEIISFINDTSISYNIGKKSIIKDFFNYIIRHKKVKYSDDFFTFVENIVHFDDCDIGHYVNYSILTLQPFLL